MDLIRVHGKVKYLAYDEKEFSIFFYQRYPMAPHQGDVGQAVLRGSDPTSAYYCYHQYREWQVNKSIDEGLLPIGMDAGCWVMAKKPRRKSR
jgi:hypothetical protein